MRIIPTEPRKGSGIMSCTRRKQCKHASKYTVGVENLWACRDCGQGLKPVTCILCDGSGSKQSRSGKLFHCRACNGTGIKAWKVIYCKKPTAGKMP